jgi:adenylate cyclase
MSEKQYKRKLSAILSADVKGYSLLMVENELATVNILNEYKLVMSETIQKYSGRVVDAPGDNLLAEFSSVVEAVEAAAQIQKELKTRNTSLPENRKMEFRIGINMGDVIEEGESIFGDGVIIAARLEGLAEAGGICVSRNVYDQVKNKLTLKYKYLGEHNVKNISEPVRVYRVIMDAKATLLESGKEHSLPDKPSIAVLPFLNMSGDPEQEYFSDGLTEDLITELSKVSGLFVIARNSVFTYKGKAVKVRDVGRELGVSYVLEGSVRKVKNKVRITAQLVDTMTDGHLWAENYDRDLDDIFALQDEVTQKIVSFLAVRLTEDEQLLQVCKCKHTCNMEAYDFYLRGMENFYRFTEHTNKQAREMFKISINLAPDYALAHAKLAETYLMDWAFGWILDLQPLEHALKSAQAALDLDDSIPEAHAVLGEYYLWNKEHDRAITELEKAISLSPNDADFYAGIGNVKTWEGKPEESISLLTKAMRLNPMYPASYLWNLGHAYYLAKKHDKAIEAFERAINLNPNWWPSHVYSAACYAELGRGEEAHTSAENVMKAQASFSLGHWEKHVPYKKQSDVDRWISSLHMAGLK